MTDTKAKYVQVTVYALKRDGKFMTSQFDTGLFSATTPRNGFKFINKKVAEHAAKAMGAVVVPVTISRRTPS